MRIESILFGETKAYQRMAQVLERSCKENSPNTPITIRRIESADEELFHMGKKKVRTYIDNARKTKHHRNIVLEAKDGELIGLLDCDMMVLKDLSPVEHYNFDFAFTPRPQGSHRLINSGAVFVRVSDKTRDWYIRWYENVEKLFRDDKLFVKWSKLFGGVNQSSLGMLLTEPHDLQLEELTCLEWNLIYDHWKKFNPMVTRIVHIQGVLKEACVGKGRATQPEVRRLVPIWRSFERQ